MKIKVPSIQNEVGIVFLTCFLIYWTNQALTNHVSSVDFDNFQDIGETADFKHPIRIRR